MSVIPFGYRWADGQISYNADWIEEDSHNPADLHMCNVMTNLEGSLKAFFKIYHLFVKCYRTFSYKCRVIKYNYKMTAWPSGLRR